MFFLFDLTLQGVETQTSILNATVDQREKFIRLIEQEPKLEYVEIPHWAGLGGICYLPPELMKTEDENAAKEVKFIQIIVNEFSFNQNVSNSKIIKIHTENLFYTFTPIGFSKLY